MTDIKLNQGIESTQALIRGDSLNIFEFEKTAFEFLEEKGEDFDGEVVEVYYCSRVNLTFANVEEDGQFAGYGVITYDDWGDPVLL